MCKKIQYRFCKKNHKKSVITDKNITTSELNQNSDIESDINLKGSLKLSNIIESKLNQSEKTDFTQRLLDKEVDTLIYQFPLSTIRDFEFLSQESNRKQVLETIEEESEDSSDSCIATYSNENQHSLAGIIQDYPS